MILGLLGAAGEEQRDGRVGHQEVHLRAGIGRRPGNCPSACELPEETRVRVFFAVLRGGSLMHDPDQARWLCTVTITVKK